MSALEEEIANVKAAIARYEAKLETVTTPQRESDITRLITASRENLTVLLQQQLAASAAPVAPQAETKRQVSSSLTTLRDAIVGGVIVERDDALLSESACYPVENNARTIFVRNFYGTFYKYLHDEILSNTIPAVIYYGPPGVGNSNTDHSLPPQSYMAMYFLHNLVRDGFTVVYEKPFTRKIFVIPPTGDCSEITGEADDELVPELKSANTVHLFDACAGMHAREPFMYVAKVVIFTSPNETSFKQHQRSGSMLFTVPSYTAAELETRRKYFAPIGDHVYQGKLEKFGGSSIRLMLGLNDVVAEAMLERALGTTTFGDVEEILRHVEVASKGAFGPHFLFSTSLAPGANPNDINSYTRENMVWNIASSYIMGELVRRRNDEALQFAERAAVVFSTTQGLEQTGGSFSEAIAPYVLAKGGIFRVRRLSGKNMKEYDQEFPKRLHVSATSITTPTDVHEKCKNIGSIYSLLKKMPGFDAFAPPNQYFNFTNRPSQPIHMKTAIQICERVRGENDKAHWYFVVPSERFDEGWRGAQLFEGLGANRTIAQLLDTTDHKKQQSGLKILGVTEEQVQLVASKMVQYVIRWDLNDQNVLAVDAMDRQLRRYSTAASQNGVGLPGRGFAVSHVLRLLKTIIK